MPTTRRRRHQEAREPLQASMRAYFETGDYDAAHEAAIAAGESDGHGFSGMTQLLLKRSGQDIELWRKHGEDIVADWIDEHSGSRPWAWWRWNAPEPRQRLGGIGTPAHEVLAYAPTFRLGIPVYWVRPWEVAYYTGTARDVEGRLIGQEFAGRDFRGVAIDPADPPRYESQAAFLDRLGLLSPAERRALPADAFEPEVVIPAAQDDDPADDGEEAR